MDEKMGYNLKKANLINTIVISTILLIFLVLAFNQVSEFEFIGLIVLSLAIEVIAILIYKLNLKTTTKGMLYSLLMLLSISALTYFNSKTTISFFIYFFISMTTISTYFNEKLIIFHGFFLNISLITLYIISSKMLLGFNSNLLMFIFTLVLVNAVIVLIYLLTRWANALTKSLQKKDLETQKLIKNLEASMDLISETSTVLDKNLKSFDLNLIGLKQSSGEITQAVNENAEGISEEAKSILTISNKIQTVFQKEVKVEELSNGIKESEITLNDNIKEGTDKINTMCDKVRVVKDAVDSSLETVIRLQESAGKITKFLSSIKRIADQTNLLSINANIEAAKAGEAGRGFAIVADEINKLATSSSEMVNNINEIIEEINLITNETFNKVAKGNLAAKESFTLVYDVLNKFNFVVSSFNTNKLNIFDETTMINNITDLFKDIEEEMDFISSMSEQHAASSEEILGNIEQQNENIGEILKAIEEMQDIVKKLVETIQK
ncbi:chemotaxis protein [Clostridium felsineum]|uniref:methyl-accepting chemotaxis protein n=1 Tax=Clostridium felsineum TaxID=36839 RepID=UPI00214D2F53|nr:methyl-accepting chemotaxis protein [Clostridium felsineum]MCR3760866.1 chemotaxis protein [Clostridium felsineum]